MTVFNARLEYPLDKNHHVHNPVKLDSYTHQKKQPATAFESSRSTYSMSLLNQSNGTDTYEVLNSSKNQVGIFKISNNSIEVGFNDDNPESKEVMLGLLNDQADKYNYPEMPKPTLHVRSHAQQDDSDLLAKVENDVINALTLPKQNYKIGKAPAEVSISSQSKPIYLEQMLKVEKALTKKFPNDKMQVNWNQNAQTKTFAIEGQGEMKFQAETGTLSISNGNNKELQQKLVEAAKTLYAENPGATIKVSSENKEIENTVAEELRKTLGDKVKIVKGHDVDQKVDVTMETNTQSLGTSSH